MRVLVPLGAALGYVALAACSAAVEDPSDVQTAEIDPGLLDGRYAVLYTDEAAAVRSLGTFILEPDGAAIFLPSWVCEESTRHPARWAVNDDDDDYDYFTLIVDDPELETEIRIHGPLVECFGGPMEARFWGQDTIVDILATDTCHSGLVGDVCSGIVCEEALAPSCRAE